MADEEYALILPDGAEIRVPSHDDLMTLAEWYVSTTDDSVTDWGRAFESGE